MSGVDWVLVGVGYLGVMLVTLILLFFRVMWARRKHARELAAHTGRELGLVDREE
jgi:hypothetical protein